MLASQILWILDINYKCYYCYCSPWQIENYKTNTEKEPLKYEFAFEIRNQPYRIQYLSKNNQGMHAVIQSGCLYVILIINLMNKIVKNFPHFLILLPLYFSF